MAGEDFDGDDDDEVTKMGVCRVHASLAMVQWLSNPLRGLAPDYLAKKIQNKV